MNSKKIVSLWCVLTLFTAAVHTAENGPGPFQFDPNSEIHLTANTIRQYPNPDFTHGNPGASRQQQTANAFGDGFNQGIFDASRSLVPLIVSTIFQVAATLLINSYTQQNALPETDNIDKTKLENIGTMTTLYERIEKLPEGPEKDQLRAQLNGVLGSASAAA